MEKRNIISVLIIVLLSSLMLVYFEFNKKGFHEDEVYSITSSVQEIWNHGLLHKNDEENKPLWLTKESVKDLLSFTDNSNIKDVYLNQVNDVHPPFFYILTFLISSILPNFTLYNIFILNLIFFWLINLVLVKICKVLKKEKLVVPTLLFYDFSMALINMVTFQRMYTMLTFFVLLYLYFNLKIKMNDFKLEKVDYIGLVITTSLGFLTQYFFVIYALVIFIIMLIYLIKAKNYQIMRRYIGIHFLAALIGLLIFPASIQHILFGGRGIGSISNDSYLNRLKIFSQIIFKNINVPAILILILLLYYLFKKRDQILTLLIVPLLISFFAIVLIVPFLEIRYIMMLIPIILLILTGISLDIFKYKFTILLILILNIVSLVIHKPSFLYQSYQEEVNISNEYQDYFAVFVTDNNFTYLKNVKEMLNYKESLIINCNDDELKYLKDDEKLNDKFILRMESYLNIDSIINDLNDLGYSKKEEILKNDNGVIYLMEKEI